MSKYKYYQYYEIIKEYKLQGKSSKEIAEILNIEELDSIKVQKIITRLGLNYNEKIKNKYKEIDKKALNLIKSGLSHRETAKKLNIDQQSMTLRLKLYYNLEVLKDGKKKVDSYFFNKIDNEEKAYWLGIMYTDGYVNQETNSIELCMKDKEHIEKFKKSLNSGHKISEKNININNKICKAYRISITDKDLVNGLVTAGCYQNKSLTITAPSYKIIPKNLLHHFLRGVFDGDGCMCICCKKGCYLFSIVSGSYKFINDLYYLIYDLTGFYLKIKKRDNCYYLHSTDTNQSYLIFKKIYDNSNIYLQRKYNKYLSMVAVLK